MSPVKPRVVVGLSGGVDSAVAAYLLKEQGYEVIGVTMRVWQEEDRCSLEESGGCCGLSDVEDARKVAEILDVPYYVMNFKEEFKRDVIGYFISEYRAGRTPNPCIACNRHVKWGALLRKAQQLGADYIATGHYARVTRYPTTGRFTLELSATAQKDQTYVLYGLTQEQLAKTLMPVGDYNKEEIRAMATQLRLPVANKRDSQEICFVSGQDYGTFIAESGDEPIATGDFVNSRGETLGRHKGIVYYTVGQRKGLGLSFGKPMYVIRIDAEKNQVVLGDHEELFSASCLVRQVSYMGLKGLETPLRLTAKIRYSHKNAPCVIQSEGDGVRVLFETSQRAVTPGQAAVFYDGSYVVAGGTIE